MPRLPSTGAGQKPQPTRARQLSPNPMLLEDDSYVLETPTPVYRGGGRLRVPRTPPAPSPISQHRPPPQAHTPLVAETPIRKKDLVVPTTMVTAATPGTTPKPAVRARSLAPTMPQRLPTRESSAPPPVNLSTKPNVWTDHLRAHPRPLTATKPNPWTDLLRAPPRPRTASNASDVSERSNVSNASDVSNGSKVSNLSAQSATESLVPAWVKQLNHIVSNNRWEKHSKTKSYSDLINLAAQKLPSGNIPTLPQLMDFSPTCPRFILEDVIYTKYLLCERGAPINSPHDLVPWYSSFFSVFRSQDTLPGHQPIVQGEHILAKMLSAAGEMTQRLKERLYALYSNLLSVAGNGPNRDTEALRYFHEFESHMLRFKLPKQVNEFWFGYVFTVLFPVTAHTYSLELNPDKPSLGDRIYHSLFPLLTPDESTLTHSHIHEYAWFVTFYYTAAEDTLSPEDFDMIWSENPEETITLMMQYLCIRLCDPLESFDQDAAFAMLHSILSRAPNEWLEWSPSSADWVIEPILASATNSITFHRRNVKPEEREMLNKQGTWVKDFMNTVLIWKTKPPPAELAKAKLIKDKSTTFG